MTNEHGEALATYYGAFEALADALVAMYNACEATGANLPEALSAALADAAVQLGFAPGPDASPTARRDALVAGLVSQRPGSWEAAAIAQLVSGG